MNKKEAKTTGERKTAIKNSVGRIITIILLLLVQLAIFIVLIAKLFSYFPVFAILGSALSFLIVLGINSRDDVASIKLIWIILILTVPLFGVVLYLIFHLSGSKRKMNMKLRKTDSQIFPKLNKDKKALGEVKELNKDLYSQFNYLGRVCDFPTWNRTLVDYYPWAKEGFDSQIEDMKKAKSFIFLEYHAIENKESFEPMLDVLIDKAKQGLDVRVIYDDIGSFVFVNKDFKEMLESNGIKCRVFNPMVPMLEVFMNHRDHRKLTVIDGKVGYTGGYNIANEYFNVTHPYGLWKDTGIRLEGPGVKTLTALFLEMWEFADYKNCDEDFTPFLSVEPEEFDVAGYVCPFGDSPLDGEPLGENVYINILNNAKDYCWFSTPYLVISDELRRAMGLASKRGVDVRIITPGIPDKKTVYQLTKSYYYPLVQDGVKIYEFTPGFNHCKMCISDDDTSFIGTINLDFRSLYHHFENGVLIYKSKMNIKLKKDFDSIFYECKNVTEEYKKPANFMVSFIRSVLRLVAPLL